MRARTVITAAAVALGVAGAGTAWLIARREPSPAPAAVPPSFATVTLHGREGTFGSLGHTTPSGQPVAHAGVPGWDFAPGVQAYRAAVAAGGAVLVAGATHNADLSASTADQVTVAAYRPAENTFSTVQIGPIGPGAPSVTDLAPVDGGVAFVTQEAEDAASGRWPAFGILATVDGQWRPAQLSGAVTGGDFHDMAVLPRSGHILVARYGRKGEANGGLLALRLTGPGPEGRFTVEVAGEYPYPRVGDGQVSVREVQVDPTSREGDERFAIGLDVDRGKGKFPHTLVQEFRYGAANGRIQPVSAPVIAGDRNRDGTAFFDYGTFLYDHAGNLWVSRSDGFHGGSLAVYTAGDGRRRLERGECRLRPDRPLDRYETAAGGAGVWGQACRPDYDIRQARHLPAIVGLAQDPAGKDVVALAFGGSLLAVRATPAGDELTFRVSNVVDLGRKLLPTVPGGLTLLHGIGAVDGAHRVWITGMHAMPGQAGKRLDQWLYSVDLADLFAPAPVVLPETPGQSVTIQAERSSTVTATVRPGRWATREVVPDVTAHSCADWPTGTTCGYDGVPGNGFVLGDDSGYGRLRGVVDYRVEVPVAGRYELNYRAATFPATKHARIALSTGGRDHVQPVSTDGKWSTVRASDPIALPAGEHTIRLSVPEGGGGWFLNSFTLRRV